MRSKPCDLKAHSAKLAVNAAVASSSTSRAVSPSNEHRLNETPTGGAAAAASYTVPPGRGAT